MAAAPALTWPLGTNYVFTLHTDDGQGKGTEVLNNAKIESGELTISAQIVTRQGLGQTWPETATPGKEGTATIEFVTTLADGYPVFEQLGNLLFLDISHTGVTPTTMFEGWCRLTSCAWGPATQDNHPTVRAEFVIHGTPTTLPVSSTKPS